MSRQPFRTTRGRAASRYVFMREGNSRPRIDLSGFALNVLMPRPFGERVVERRGPFWNQ